MALILVTMLMSACSRPPAEERLRHQVETMLEAVRTGNARGFMAGVTEDFAGNGGMDRAALHNLLRAQILANADIGISSGPWDIQVQGEHASLRMRVILAGGGRLLPDRAQTYDLTSGWREEDGEWRVYYAEWKPLL
ncbi:hypothetical protein CSC70_08925 [Pseudoxanthomonas kalamensis DSM 18571]|uniref:nuclear transport factor 2 family protein n=1 Tax=Pseudoxanthomonas kalamensis TaxID=289483 RepID=UPI0013911EA3|nr:nuclear transport factor 2 family protein [Pseudoxanthomonas kalamensis]KAF1709811.1 hypothetical protein CSC70_08925 [Pseudoxanthomonas kalamensis DSM 18571]